MSYDWSRRIKGGLLVYEVLLLFEDLDNVLTKTYLTVREVDEKLTRLMKNLRELGMEELGEKISMLSSNIARKYNYNYDRGMSDDVKSQVKEELKEYRILFKNELTKKPIVVFKPKGRLDYGKLIEKGIGYLFPDINILYKLNEIVKHDLEEALYCLCFERPTATTMVALRAVEAAIRQLYLSFKPDARIERINWKDVLNELEKMFEQNNIEAKTLLGYLNHLREIRNKAEHPDKIFDQIEAEDALMNACYAIKEIYKIINELESRRKAK